MFPETPILFTPGPVTVPDFVHQALSTPAMYHRNVDFEEIMKRLQTGLQYFFQTQALTGGMIGSGTTGMEAMLYSLFTKGDKILVAHNGKFSQRWYDYTLLIGLQAIPIATEWGKTISINTIQQHLQQNPDAKGIVLTHCETSTGVCLDLEEISFMCRKIQPNIVLVADVISTLGAIPFYMDDWGINAAVVASQKTLLNPAGTCYFALDAHAQAQLRPTHASDCFNLYNYTTYLKQNSFPYSPPFQLFMGVIASLEQYQKIQLYTKWNEVHALAREMRAHLIENGWKLFGESPSDGMTCFYDDDPNRMANLKKNLSEKKITLSGGQDELKGKVLRMAHFGEYPRVAIEILKSELKKKFRKIA